MKPEIPNPQSNQTNYRKAYKGAITWLSILLITLAGLLLILVGLGKFDEGSLLYLICVHGGTALLPVGIISLLYETLLRKTHLQEMKESLSEAISDLDIPNKVQELMPSRFANIREAGISDAYNKFNLVEIVTAIDALYMTEIRILGIYLEHDSKLCNAIKEAVEMRGCTAKIILWNPEEKDALAKRAESLKSHTEDDLSDNIKRSLRMISSTRKRMKAEDAAKIQVKLYRSFIGIAMIGYEGTYHIGFYLRERLVSDGTHLKVEVVKRHFYKDLHRHFLSQWEDPSNVIFDETFPVTA